MGPEQQRQAPLETLTSPEAERFDVRTDTVLRTTGVMASAPPSGPRDAALAKKMGTVYGLWQQQTATNLETLDMAGQAETVKGSLESQGLPEPVRKDLEKHLQRIIDASRKEKVDPLTLGQKVQDLATFLGGLPPLPGLQGAWGIVNGYAQAMGRRPAALQMWGVSARDTMKTGVGNGIGEQQSTIARLGITIGALVLFLGFAATAAHGKWKGEKGSNGATGAALALLVGFLAIMGPRLMQSGTERWKEEVKFLGTPGNDFDKLRHHYQFGANPKEWAEVARKLQEKQLSDEAKKLIFKKPLTPEEGKKLLEDLAPQGSALSAPLSQMILGPGRVNRAEPGADFRAFAAIITQLKTKEGKDLTLAFLQNGADPAMMAQMPIGQQQ